MSKPPESFQVDLAPLVNAALVETPGDTNLGMTRLMRAVAQATDSYGCILWRKRSKKDEFILLAGWFPDVEIITLSRMAKQGTVAGNAVDNRHSVENDLVTSGNPNAHHPFLKHLGVNRTMACKISIDSSSLPGDKAEDGWVGALNLYRRGKRSDASEFPSDKEFSEKEMPALIAICDSIPALFRATRDKMALRLFHDTEDIIASYHAPKTSANWESNLKDTIASFGIAIQRAFRSMEVSVYLRKLQRGDQRYQCWFTTEGEHKDFAEAAEYRGGIEEGFTGLCLIQDEPIRVADIRHPDDEEQEYKNRYTGFQGHATRSISKRVLARQGLKDEEAPPHSMLYCRLAVGAEVFGLVRCRIAEQGPVIYHSEDADLLKRVCQSFAQNLAGWWEAHRWEESVEGVAEYKSRGKSENAHLVAALELLEKVVPGAEVNTARLIDAAGDNLVFAAHSTEARREFQEAYAREGLKKTFPLRIPPGSGSVAADVVRSKRGERFASSDPRYQNLFRGVKEVIIAPIKNHDDEVYGVLDARARTSFPNYALRLVEIIANLVGMQHAHLLEVKKLQHREQLERLAELQRVQEKLEIELKNIQAFEDAAHQIKTPLNAARKLVEASNKFRIIPDTHLLETALRRADLASKLINTFADIANGNLDLSHHDLPPERLGRLIRVLVSDIRRTSIAERNLHFDYDEDSILKHAPKTLMADENLISQAVYNVLENGEKYTFSNNRIRCFGARSKKGRFYIAVTSRGERIEPSEVELCKRRRWRSPRVGSHTGSGSGLGLYIVDKIMNVHRGSLIIIPTDRDGVTEVRLEFPEY
jgi:signal transduction histidine kinase